MKGLIVDFGGVLTTSVTESFKTFCETTGVDPERLKAALKGEVDTAESADSHHPLHLIEVGAIDAAEFNRHLATELSVGLETPLDPAGLKDRLFEHVRPDPLMVAAVAGLRQKGVKTALLSNSWGGDGYPREAFAELFDAVIISGEVRMRKPDPSIYRHAAEQIGLEPADCVFVDDLLANVEGAKAAGMTAIHHKETGVTLGLLEELFSVPDSGAPGSPSSLN